jgi:peptidoglycan/xylan/chitin deacetylase (PgdA/CDA1 family)
MNRFLLTSLIALLIFMPMGHFMHGWTRIWALTALWTVYLTIVGCGIGFIQMQFFGPVILKARRDAMEIALTFDDGPDPNATPALLDLLKSENITATFFCIGKNVEAHPEIAARIIADGHLIGNHTYHHAWWTPLLMHRKMLAELELAQTAIQKATGTTPIYMRPPVGHTNPHYTGVLKQLNMQMIGWDVRSMDTRWPTEKVIARVLHQTQPGSIILLHDGLSTAERIQQIIPPMIRELRSRGFRFTRLDHLLQESP